MLVFPALLLPNITVRGAKGTSPVSFQALKFRILSEVSIVFSATPKCNLSLTEPGSSSPEELFCHLDVQLYRFEQLLLGQLLKGRVGYMDGPRPQQQRLAPVA